RRRTRSPPAWPGGEIGGGPGAASRPGSSGSRRGPVRRGRTCGGQGMTWTVPAFENVAGLVSQRTGLALANRRIDAEQAIRTAMARPHIKDPDDYAARLNASVDLFEDLIDLLTVGETYFFREPDQFAFLRREILPDVLRRCGPGHIFRAWSAGCAS